MCAHLLMSFPSPLVNMKLLVHTLVLICREQKLEGVGPDAGRGKVAQELKLVCRH